MAQAGISGIGVISALGRNAAETASALYADPPKLPALPTRFETKLSLPVFEIADPEPGAPCGMPLRFLRAALAEALAHAKLTPEMLRTRKVGIAVGTTVACQLDDIPCHDRLRHGDRSDLSSAEQYVTGLPAEYLRRELGLDGPAVTVSNACASGADAAMIGLEWLRTGECDLVIAAGCDSVSKVAFDGFNALRVSSPAPCRPFDAERSGLNLGDGAGVIVLEPPEKAAERGVHIAYELAGAGKTADAFHITQPENSGTELERAIRAALREAGLDASEIDFVNAHGTGTPVNDRVESGVLARVFGPGVKFQSTKALTGHTLGAAGAIELIFTEMMLRDRRAAVSRRYEHPSEEIPVAPLTAPAEIPGNAAVSTSLAFGGSNTALAVRKLRPENLSALLRKEIYVSAFRCLDPGEPDRDGLVKLCRKYALRRPDRLTQMALAAADAAADRLAGMEGETALITVTAYGPANTTCRVLDDILDFPEEEILPTGFSHSVINAAGSYIGASLKIHGPTFALAGFEDPFFEAAELARVLLSAGHCRRALIVAADERSLISEAVETLRKSPAPERTEGACALLLSSDPEENRLGHLRLHRNGNQKDGRLLPCGIPAGFPKQLERSGPEAEIDLARLSAPEWKSGQPG
ncbi:MAG: beta-ketoacyl-[Lentisphaeria bacterium]|nr:beta-ketoacyl-[acyl-carrier-protein] synthase family protein [Lentisphaeria bacterium]